jgi:hypothetical protein
MPKPFSQPDRLGAAKETEVQAQDVQETKVKTPPTYADGVDAYDMADYIAQSREGASTGQRQKLEANAFVDEELLGEAGYSASGEYVETETVETSEVPAQTEISEEWLEIFAWAGVELTDEAMPRLLQYLHAEDDYTRFKLPPNRRDKLKLAWIAFLRKVLPAMDDKQGLLAVIIMLYIENIVVGVYKLFGRVITGTFAWPKFWPFTNFGKKKVPAPTPSFANQPQAPAPEPEYTADELALMDEPHQPAPSAAKETPSTKPAFEPVHVPAAQLQVVKAEPKELPAVTPAVEVIQAPVPTPMLGSSQVQDPIDSKPFDKKDGMPKEDWERTAPNQTTVYRTPKHTFRTQSTFQKWLWRDGFYDLRGKKK